jgi:hypothetical protein
MRRHRATRLLLIPALAAPLMFFTLLDPTGSAWAKKNSNLTIQCVGINGNDGGTLTLQGCSHPEITGDQGTISLGSSQGFPQSPTTITWSPGADRSIPPLVTTIRFRRVEWTVRKNRCGAGSDEFRMTGTVIGNSASPGVKGRVKIFECDTGGVLTALQTTSIRF